MNHEIILFVWWLWWALSWRSSPSFSLHRSAMTRRGDLCRFPWGHDWRVFTKAKRASKIYTCESCWRWVFAFNMMELVIPNKRGWGLCCFRLGLTRTRARSSMRFILGRSIASKQVERIACVSINNDVSRRNLHFHRWASCLEITEITEQGLHH